MKHIAPISGTVVPFEQVVHRPGVVSDGNGLLQPSSNSIGVIDREIVGENRAHRRTHHNRGCNLLKYIVDYKVVRGNERFDSVALRRGVLRAKEVAVLNGDMS